MDKHKGIIWPPLEAAYTDEFGEIDPEVYVAAGRLWSQGERFALSKLGDGASGLRLMIKATALVSRALASRDDPIANLPAYLFHTYRRLVIAELKEEKGHRQLETERQTELQGPSDSPAADIDRKILIEQIMARMDDWTRGVFQLRVLGHSFEEIGKLRGRNAHALRSKFNKRLKRLTKQIQSGE